MLVNMFRPVQSAVLMRLGCCWLAVLVFAVPYIFQRGPDASRSCTVWLFSKSPRCCFVSARFCAEHNLSPSLRLALVFAGWWITVLLLASRCALRSFCASGL